MEKVVTKTKSVSDDFSVAHYMHYMKILPLVSMQFTSILLTNTKYRSHNIFTVMKKGCLRVAEKFAIPTSTVCGVSYCKIWNIIYEQHLFRVGRLLYKANSVQLFGIKGGWNVTVAHHVTLLFRPHFAQPFVFQITSRVSRASGGRQWCLPLLVSSKRCFLFVHFFFASNRISRIRKMV